METYIKINDLKIDNGKVITFELSYSKNIESYLLHSHLYIEYDEDISKVPKSILYIPAISGTIFLAWHLGADICVAEVDQTYLDSINKIKKIMNNWYPSLPYSKILAKKIVSNNFHNSKCGMLFSGGLDSMATYIRHRGEKPSLIHCVTRDKYKNSDKSHLVRFACDEDVDFNIVKTNINSVLHEALLSAKFGVDWWGNINHSMVYTGLSAPLTSKKMISKLLIASSHTSDFKLLWGSNPLLDNSIAWSGTNVNHDGYELSRQDKIKYVFKDQAEGLDGYKFLRTLSIIPDDCRGTNMRAREICGKCGPCLDNKREKCLRTIVGLVLEDIDCNNCGFNADRETFDQIKQRIMGGRLYKKKLLMNTFGEYVESKSVLFFWEDIQKHISHATSNPHMYNSEEFFKWFRDYDISKYKDSIKLSDLPRLLLASSAFYLYPFYCNSPKCLRNSNLIKKFVTSVHNCIS